LGLRTMMRVVHALGQLSRPANEGATNQTNVDGIGRKQFLQFGAGLLVAAGVMATGQMPAFAKSGRSKALAWVEANQDKLPQRYADIAAYPMAYRRAIFSELGPEIQRTMWLDHLDSYRATHKLTREQSELIDRATELAKNVCSFDAAPAKGSDFDRRAQELTDAVKHAFGDDEARALLKTLGPVEDPIAASLEPDGILCPCSDQCHDYCEGSRYCKYGGCDFTRSCCIFWQYVCNGFCVN